jgi:virginiamycin B lyase
VSDDGHVVAFLRRSQVKRSELDGYEQSALWAVERDGNNLRELVSAEALRERLNAGETDSTNIPQMEWIPGTHRLLYTGWTYLVQADGESHAIPRGLYLVDADARTDTALRSAEDSLRFVPSPEGRQIALLSSSSLSVIHADGSNWRQDLFHYTPASVPGQIIPSGVWTQDGGAFLITLPTQRESDLGTDVTIWRVPVDGALVRQPLATITQAHSDSVTFSPDGRYVAFSRADSPGTATHWGWFVTPLALEIGPLALPTSSYLSWQNLHWSPTGVPYAIHEGTLARLCPDPAQDAEVCGEGLDLGRPLAEIYWIDGTRFLFVTRELHDLYLGRLDGTRILIAEGVERFSTVPMTCRNESEAAVGGTGLADMSVAPDTLFPMTWRLRNTGTCAWDASYRLGFLSGERMRGPHSLALGETVPPGGEIELSVNLIAPPEGRYWGKWQLFAPNGRPFGAQLAVDVVVPSYAVSELAPDQIIARIPAEAGRVAFGEGALWVLGANAVSRLDLVTNQVVANVPVGEFSQALAVGYGAVWTAGLDRTVVRIDPLTSQVSRTIPVAPASGLNGIAAGAGAVWVTSGEHGLLYRIDPDTNQVIATIQVEPWASQIAATQEAIWVTNPISPILTRIDPDTNEVSAAIRLDCSTRDLAADVETVWVACDSVPALLRIDPVTNRMVARIAVGHHPRGVAISSSGIWIASLTDNTLSLIAPDTNQVVAVYQVGAGPVDVAAGQDEVWSVLSGEGAIWRLQP